MNLLTNFYIVNHGESEIHAKKIVAGHLDGKLTKKGQEQVKRLARELQYIHFDDAISSDLIHAKQTAEIIAIEKELAITTTHLLRDRSYGVLEGTKLEEFHDLYDNWEKLSEQQRWNHKFTNEESQYEALSRFVVFLRETAVGNPGKTILIVSHGPVMRAFLIALGYGDWRTIGGFWECSYIHVQSDGVDFFMKTTRGIKQWQDIAANI